MRERQPIFHVPGPVLALIAVMIAVHAARSLLGEADQLWWLVALAFIPARYAENAAQILAIGFLVAYHNRNFKRLKAFHSHQ